MKTRLQTTSVGMALAATMLLGTMGCNDDWGQKDPEAGNQVFPTLSTVATIAFEDENGAHALPAGYADKTFAADATAEVLDDDVALSPVLALNNAVASFNNPLKDSKCQTGVSFSFWMRQPLETDEEGNVIGEQDLRTPIIAFVNPKPADAVEPDAPTEGGEEAQSREGEGEGEGEGDEPSTNDPSTDEPATEENPYEVYGTLEFSANGMIKYDADNGLFSDNDPDQFLTGYITPNEWHFVAVNIYDEGYAIYVDGMRKVDKYVPNFNCHKMVEFANNAKLICLNGTPDSESAPALHIDDLTLARNNFTAKEIKMPKKGNIGVEGGNDDGFVYPIATKLEIGASDCSTGWWTEFSDYFSFPANTALHLGFTNHTSGGGNWNNWNLCVSTNDERGGGNYNEYIVIRSDLYGWGSAYNGDNWTNTGYGDWDAFRADMEGAYVNIDIVRVGEKVTVKAVATAINGNVYEENFWFNSADADEVLNAFLIVDGSYLEMDPTNTYYYTPVVIEKTEIGASDCSTGWWTEFSDYFSFPANTALHLEFTNHTSGGGNWNNWNLCVSTNDERGGGNYNEYVVIRSDLYGWGSAYNGDNWTNTGYGDWDAFRVDMEGADVKIDINRAAEKVTIKAVATAINGKVYEENFWFNSADADEVLNAFLIVDGSYLEMKSVSVSVPAFK